MSKSSFSLVDVSEQLYAAKFVILFITLFNVFTALYSMISLASSNRQYVALLCGLVALVNLVFLFVGAFNWKKEKKSLVLEEVSKQ